MRRKRMSGEQRRQQLIAVSAQLFAEKGYWKAGTNDIARAAGISEPTIYRHFSTKEELFCDVAAEAAQNLLSSLKEADLQGLEDLRRWLRDKAHEGPALAMVGRLLHEARLSPFKGEAMRFLSEAKAALQRYLGETEGERAMDILLAHVLLAAAGLIDGARREEGD